MTKFIYIYIYIFKINLSNVLLHFRENYAFSKA